MPSAALSRSLVLALGSCVCSLAGAQVSIGGIEFVDRAASGEIPLGDIRGPLAVIDYDNDGWMDLFIGDNPNEGYKLFHNIPDPQKPGKRTFVNVAAAAGLTDNDARNRPAGGVLAGDVDNDGFQDIYVVGWVGDGSYGILYHNNGNGTFTNISQIAGVRSTAAQQIMSASFVDFDLDGHLDLFVAGPGAGADSQRLLRNTGIGKFSDYSSALPAPAGAGVIYSHLWTDFDSDGDQDCVLLTQGGAGPRIMRNEVSPAGFRQFAAVSTAVGYTFLGPSPMGIASGDYDNDGDFDLAITDASVGTYYRNDSGFLTRITPMSSIFGWGVAWLDADNDGDLDNYQAGSFPSSANFDRLFRNDGGGSFTDIHQALNASFSQSQYSAKLDWNNDGREELATVNPGIPGHFVSLFENISTTPGQWLKLALKGDGIHVNRDAVGAVARVLTQAGVQTREVIDGSSTTSTEDLRLHFGLGPAQVTSIEITWPWDVPMSLRKQVITGPVTPGQVLTVQFRCVGDYNDDSFVDAIDYDLFINDWLAADARADVNADGFVDAIDYDVLVARFLLGC